VQAVCGGRQAPSALLMRPAPAPKYFADTQEGRAGSERPDRRGPRYGAGCEPAWGIRTLPLAHPSGRRSSAPPPNGTCSLRWTRAKPEPSRTPPRCTTPPRYQALASRRMCRMATSEANFSEHRKAEVRRKPFHALGGIDLCLVHQTSSGGTMIVAARLAPLGRKGSERRRSG
jgi:hypothetical protein